MYDKFLVKLICDCSSPNSRYYHQVTQLKSPLSLSQRRVYLAHGSKKQGKYGNTVDYSNVSLERREIRRGEGEVFCISPNEEEGGGGGGRRRREEEEGEICKLLN